MNIDQFWALIEPGSEDEAPEESLRERLAALEPSELEDFQKHFDQLFGRAYRWDLWGAAYLIEGGCSDDGFIDFRYALISKGKRVYEEALRAPDTLAKVDIVGNESFGYVAQEVYEEKTGRDFPNRHRTHPDDPVGDDWDFEDVEECRRRLPNVTERFWEQ
jgi:uncharacterized protein DUF4240